MDYTSHMCCLQAAEAAEQRAIGRDKPEKKEKERKKRPKSQTIEHVTPDSSQLEPPPFVVGAVPAEATPGHNVELAGEPSDEILPALLHNALYVRSVMQKCCMCVCLCMHVWCVCVSVKC